MAQIIKKITNGTGKVGNFVIFVKGLFGQCGYCTQYIANMFKVKNTYIVTKFKLKGRWSKFEMMLSCSKLKV